MSLSFKDLPADLCAGVQLWHADVAICQTLAKADALRLALNNKLGQPGGIKVFQFAAGHWFVVNLTEPIAEDTDVKDNNA